MAMQRLTEQILAHAGGLPEGTPLAAKSLLHLGNRAAVDQALSRLTERGQLIRAGRGVYLRPITSRSEEHTSELQSLMRISYAVFCLKKKNNTYFHNLIYVYA